MRSAACFDVPLSIIEPCGFPLTAKSLRRAAMDYGAPERLIRYKNWDEYSQAGESARTVLLTTKAAQPMTQFTFLPSDRLLLGRESAGVPDAVHKAAQARVLIPIAQGARSFNLSVSAALALYEALRQTGGLP